MIVLKTSRELAIMRKAGKISQKALRLAGEAVEPGVSAWEIDKMVRNYIESMGAAPSFLHYNGYPASTCISINDVVIHGIPQKSTILKKGDIVSIDVGACYQGFHGDNAWTFACGEIDPRAQALMDATEKSLFLGIEQARPGKRLGDIGHAVQAHTSEEVMRLMQQVVREQRKTLVMVTHDSHLATYADRVFHIRDGKILKIEYNLESEENS